MKLVSLHLPKTAGSSFGKSLEMFFGDSFLRDYEDRPISKPAYERQRSALLSSVEIAARGLVNVDCVHGHFLPVKYLLLSTRENIKFVTWMRDPVERLISQYNFWQRSYDPRTAPPHHKQVMEEKWTLEQFCLSPRFRNLYGQYLWAFPVEYFDFIGVTEHYEEDLAYFAENYLAGVLRVEKLNTANTETTVYSIDSSLRKRIESYHEQDMALYLRALELRRNRRPSGRNSTSSQ